MYVVIVYDVEIERIDQVRKFLRRYLNWIQNSVFEGELTLAELEEVMAGVKNIINIETDYVILYGVRTEELLMKKKIGKPKSEPSTII